MVMTVRASLGGKRLVEVKGVVVRLVNGRLRRLKLQGRVMSEGENVQGSGV